MRIHEQYKIGFVRSGTHPQNLLAFQRILKDENIGVFGICINSKERDGYSDESEKYCFEDWLKNAWDTIDINALSEYQKKYSEYNLWEIYYTDRYIRYKYNYDDAVRVLIGLIEFWENILTTNNVLCIAADCIIGSYNFVGMIVGKQYGVKYISYPSARIKKYMTFFSEEEGYINFELQKLLSSSYKATDEELYEVKKFIDEYVRNKSQPYYIKEEDNQQRRLLETLKELLGKVRHISYFWNGVFRNKYDVVRYKEKWGFINSFKEAVRGKFVSRYFNKPDHENDQYVLYPLHFQPEASTCVYARKYENQLFFLEQLSKSIPAGLKIYVKEHSVRLGHKPLSFYRELRKYPNIKLISADEDIHKLIQRAQYLVVLTSTAGFEALMYGKPVFVCGDVFYEGFSGVKKIHDVFDQKKEFLHPPRQDRDVYVNQMACYLKTLNICSTEEEQLQDESPANLLNLQKKSIKALLDYLGVKNDIKCEPYKVNII